MFSSIRVIFFLAILSLIPNEISAGPRGSHDHSVSQPPAEEQFWMVLPAKTAAERTAISETGVVIEEVEVDHVFVLGGQADLERLRKGGFNPELGRVPEGTLDFPAEDSEFHDFTELQAALDQLAAENPDILTVTTIGQSVEGRPLRVITFSPATGGEGLPEVVFMGGHHAREHISVETPLRMAQRLVASYRAEDAQVRRLLSDRIVHILPLVNPDGAEYDITGCRRYCSWRKNRAATAKKGVVGVDLNRNYSYMWGQPGASDDPRSDTYRGPAPFSEPETQAIRDFILAHPNITILLSFHTFSELILYPWGHVYTPIENGKDRAVYENMAETMAKWNRYQTMQSSGLYIVSGDTTDWAYAERGIFSFTFELDPKNLWSGGFYPGQDVIGAVLEKNWLPVLYLIEMADNPYRAAEPEHLRYGLSVPSSFL